MLLDKGAYVNAQGGSYRNALQAASAGGHDQVVQMLLDKGADVNAQGGFYGNALEAASAGGHDQVVQMLLDKGALRWILWQPTGGQSGWNVPPSKHSESFLLAPGHLPGRSRTALSWDTNQQDFRPTSAPFKDAILGILCPLIVYRVETDTFRLVHLSLYEYLFNEAKQQQTHQDVSHFFFDPNDIQGELADMTLAQIANNYISRSISVDSDQYPFATYATKNWCHRLSLSPHDPTRFRKYSDFIAHPDRRSTWILRWLLSEDTSFPLQQIVRLQKLVQDWLEKGNSTTGSVDSLCDIQRALFRLDELPQSMPGLRMISNVERLVCVRDLAREFTSAGKLDDGVRMFEAALYLAGTEHHSIELGSCWLLNSLRILYDQQGNATLAEETQQRAL
ncbi:MAG: hypothetical protein L6R42_010937, partial [Xanthoria sp. 1 TBL-2021]